MKVISKLMLVSSAGLLLSTTAHAYDCSQLPQYVNGSTYAAGALVKNVNKAFSCTVGGWCSVGGPYEPGVGWAASNAWSDLGSCQTTTTSSSAATSSIPASSKAASSTPASSVPASSTPASSTPASSKPASSSVASSLQTSSSTSSVATGVCAGINVYPNWTQKDWAGNPSYANGGDQMQYQGVAYKANWWTQAIPGSDGSWVFVKNCSGTTSSSSVAPSSVSSVSSSKSSAASSVVVSSSSKSSSSSVVVSSSSVASSLGSSSSSSVTVVISGNYPNRANPVSLKVKGWPSDLAMGSFTDNNTASNDTLAASGVDSIFNNEGNGTGNRGQVIVPSVTTQTLLQARDIERVSGASVLPVIGVATADASGLGTEDILDSANLVKHFQNLIRVAATVQANKDSAHAHPGALVLNAGLLAQWQANQNGSFKTAFGSAGSWVAIDVKQAVKDALTNEANYAIGSQSLSAIYNLNSLKSEVDSALQNNVTGWVQAHNLLIKRLSPDVSFGWVAGVSSPGNNTWVHTDFAGLQDVWDAAAFSVSTFANSIGAYATNSYRPDFLAFDQSADDGLSPSARTAYAFGAKEWENYLNYVRQVTDSLSIPAMLWQIPGGHLASVSESTGSYNLANDSGTAGTYFMGDKNIGTTISNVRSEVLSIPLSASVYAGANNVNALLQQTSNYDWGTSALRRAAFSNVFAILWGSNAGTSVVPTVGSATDNGWLKAKIAANKATGGMPLYGSGQLTTASAVTTIAQLNSDLASVESAMNNQAFLYTTPSNAKEPSSVYKWADFLVALNAMHNVGVGPTKYWLIDPTKDDATNAKYAKVAIAAFLSQSMKETIQYDACDENNWSINTGDPVNYPISAACGQLQQDYASYGQDPITGRDNPYSCPRNPKMEVTAVTNAKWYGAPGPLFAAPNKVLAKKGLLVNGNVGYWDYSAWFPAATTVDTSAQAYLREEGKVYEGQKAGKFVWNGSAGKNIEGCGWWGRGVIQTTGRLNFGKLNHFLGRSHVDPAYAGQVVDGIAVTPAPADPLYADMDLCSNPELICSSTQHGEIKWIAGLFFWMNEVQGYHDPAYNWDYYAQLKAYVDGGMKGDAFINAVSGIVNRGCPDSTCPISGTVDGLADRKANFVKVLQIMGLNPQ
jgi:hypothetical protein